MAELNCTPRQMMAIVMSQQIKDGDNVIVGTGLPLVASALAKMSFAPNVCLIFETGMFDGGPVEIPTSVSDLRIAYKASALWPQFRYFGFQTNAWKKNSINLGFLGGAQIDPYGNLNSTSIGDYWNPKTRFTGSGGANGIATNCSTVIMMQHQKRRFIDKVDYITSPGWLDGPGGREKAGLRGDRGPQAVVTEMGVMKFDETTKKMYLHQYFPGYTAQDVKDNTGFDLDISKATECPLPSQEIIDILITKVDPQRLMI
jgi:glutaconate CoA-transferase subunit B